MYVQHKKQNTYEIPKITKTKYFWFKIVFEKIKKNTDSWIQKVYLSHSPKLISEAPWLFLTSTSICWRVLPPPKLWLFCISVFYILTMCHIFHVSIFIATTSDNQSTRMNPIYFEGNLKCWLQKRLKKRYKYSREEIFSIIAVNGGFRV